jgi:hypothetical protein
MGSERNDAGGTAAAVAALLEQRRGLAMHDRDTSEVDRELEARGYDAKAAEKQAKADLDAAQAERQRVHKDANEAAAAARRAAAESRDEDDGTDDARNELPKGRTSRPQSKG